MLRDQGKRLPTLLEYADTLGSLAGPDDLMRNQFGMFTELSPGLVVPVSTGPDRYRLLPGAEFSPRLYRGETKSWPTSEPSIYRKPVIEAWFGIVKMLEFGEHMGSHPALSDMTELTFEGYSFDFNIEALAQHYQHSTHYMDFSRSKEVAMFFATQDYDDNRGVYTPTNQTEVVLYSIDLAAMIRERQGVAPLGFEPLPRAVAQLAFAVPMKAGEDLNRMPWLHEKTIVSLQSGQAEDIHAQFDGGAALFPHEPFDEFLRDARINNRIDMRHIALAVKLGAIPRHPNGLIGVAKAFEAAGKTVGNSAGPTLKMIEEANAAWLQRRDAFRDNLRVRGSADHYQQ